LALARSPGEPVTATDARPSGTPASRGQFLPAGLVVISRLALIVGMDGYRRVTLWPGRTRYWAIASR